MTNGIFKTKILKNNKKLLISSKSERNFVLITKADILSISQLKTER
jgi:hypothetical protein